MRPASADSDVIAPETASRSGPRRQTRSQGVAGREGHAKYRCRALHGRVRVSVRNVGLFGTAPKKPVQPRCSHGPDVVASGSTIRQARNRVSDRRPTMSQQRPPWGSGLRREEQSRHPDSSPRILFVWRRGVSHCWRSTSAASASPLVIGGLQWLQTRLQNAVLSRQVLILQQEFLVDQSGNVGQKPRPCDCVRLQCPS